jgi:glycosyltransferase involved in cell wall biosynthesis
MRHEVTAVTTCAVDYRSWRNHFPAGESRDEGVRVVRFSVARLRRWRTFGWQSQRLFSKAHSIADEVQWLLRQGPVCPDLLRWIEANQAAFDSFIFVTYLYYPTVLGLPYAADKAVLIPTAHDEPPLRLDIYRPLFHLPRFIAFNTPEEERLIHMRFRNAHVPHRVIGVGVDLEQQTGADGGFLLYAGRIESGKSAGELFELARHTRLPIKVIGPAQIPVPPVVDYLGVVDESVKRDLLSRCRAVVSPSRQESLSLLVLEAWAHGKPVIVSGESAVLRAQVERSGGGYVYSDPAHFGQIAAAIDPAVGQAGRRYVEQHYSWDVVLRQYEAACELAGGLGVAGRGR